MSKLKTLCFFDKVLVKKNSVVSDYHRVEQSAIALPGAVSLLALFYPKSDYYFSHIKLCSIMEFLS